MINGSILHAHFLELIDIRSTLVEIGKTQNCVKTLRHRVFSQFLIFPIFTCVGTTVYHTANMAVISNTNDN